jgi:hypothetical protein
MRKLLSILASTLIIFFIACAISSEAISPENPSTKSYSIAKEAPDWMVKFYEEDSTGRYGLLDWFGWQMEGIQYHMIKTDVTMEDGILDGKCDTIIFLHEHAPATCRTLGTAPCEKWDELKENILKEINDGSV